MAGFSISPRRPARVADRVAVFIDYQNIYMGARGAFNLTDHYMHGQVHPLRVGLALKNMGVGERDVVDVRIYRGMPSPERDPKGYGAADRQIALWRNTGKVTVRTRPLNYRDPFQPKEKGIDVQIAVDYVRMAIENKYDVGVLFSADTDLLPALEAVCEMKGERSCEVAAWVPEHGSPSVLRVKGSQIRFHYLDRAWYDRLYDPTDYNARRRRR